MRVENNDKATTRRLRGGVTGKGFEPGRSGNPGGRPKGTLLDKTLVELLEADGGQDLERSLKGCSLDLSRLSDSELKARLIKLLVQSPEVLQEASRAVNPEKRDD